MRLSDYIRHVGPEKFAKEIGANKRTVESWMRGERYPRPKQAQKIVDRHPLTMSDIYGKREAA